MRSLAGLVIASVGLALGGCADEDSLALGAQCDLNSDCEAPLVCRLERCRNECTVSRDCPLGARCVVDNEGLGSCTLDREDDCTGAEDCPETLHCVVGACRNLCEGDDDCASDATCRPIEDRMACFAPGDVPDAGTPPTDASVRDGGGRDAAAVDGSVPDAGGDTGVTPCTTDPGLPPCDACTIVDVSAGGQHSCAVRSDGRVFCWGSNAEGQLGRAGEGSAVPVEVPGISNASRVSAGLDHTCALLSDGSVWCWGNDGSGQLGDGSPSSSGPTPVRAVSAMASHVSAGDLYACAVVDGDVLCWGSDSSGRLGNGAAGGTDAPGPVAGLDAVTMTRVAASHSHTCAVSTSGDVYCWGSNRNGQLGPSATGGSADTAVLVGGVTGADSVTTGSRLPADGFTCARTGSDVSCWGINSFGELGDGTGADSSSPVALDVTAGMADVAAGPSNACAVTVDGRVFCWGTDTESEGARPGSTSSDSPVRVPDLEGADSVSAGGGAIARHVCIARRGGAVCWGSNAAGQIGAGFFDGRLEPHAVCGL